MKKSIHLKKLLFFCSFLVLFTACKDDDNGGKEMIPDPTLTEIVVASSALTQLEAAVIKADLADTLNGSGPFTVFAPTDDAFVALLGVLGDDYNSIEDFDTPEEIALLKNILLYHVVPAKVLAADLSAGDVATAFTGNSISVIASGNSFVIGDASDTNATITGTDIMASNGVAHTINKVLLPQAALDFVAGLNAPTESLVDIVVATEALSSLEAAVIKADLVDTLNGDGPFTVFAPTDDAFTALLDALGDNYNSLEDFDTTEEIALLKDILLFHVVPDNKVLAANLAAGDIGTALADNSIAVIASGDTFVIGDASDTDAEITGTDIMATNGVAHTINKVLLPQAAIDFVQQITNGSLVDLVVATEALSSLEAAVIKADLVDTLNGDGPFTVFAPTDDAFTALLDALGDNYNSLEDFDTTEEIALLKDILLFHVVPDKVLAASLTAGDVGTALADNSIAVIASGDTFVIGDASDTDAEITGTDIMATNGVAHTINKVLLPQAAIDFVQQITNGSLVDLVVATEALSSLEAAVIKADLVDTLNGDGPFTVFAPTDDAFTALLDALGDNYNSLEDFDTTEEIALLKDILLFHVVPDKVLAGDLAAGDVGTALADNSIAVIASGDTFVIGDASDTDAAITGTDIMATNGVAHTINKVLLPQAAIDFVQQITNGSLVDLVVATEALSSLEAAVIKADLVDTLNGDGPFTVFAPTDDAFTALLDALGDNYNSLEDFDTNEEIALLKNILLYHVVPAKVLAADLAAGDVGTALADNSIAVIASGDTFVIGDASDTDAEITGTDIMATNGVAHTIGKVLLPQEAIDFVATLTH